MVETTIYAENYKSSAEKAIQKAINVCAAQGGGSVVVGAGDWKTGPLHLTDHIHLVLEKGAKLIFSSCSCWRAVVCACGEYLPHGLYFRIAGVSCKR